MIDEVTAVEKRPDPKCIIIGVAGGTGSGKSTFTNRLKEEFGDRVTVIYHDNYYRRQDGVPFEERIKVNYDHPDSLETDLLVRHLRELRHGRWRQTCWSGICGNCATGDRSSAPSMIIRSITGQTRQPRPCPTRSSSWKGSWSSRMSACGI